MLLLFTLGCADAAEPTAPPPPVVDPASLPRGQCENGATGADGYFVGDFTVVDGKVSGTETWYLFANDAWKKHGGLDCSITWTVKGTVDGPSPKCPACERSLRFVAEPDVASSRCPAEMLRGRISPTGARVGGEAQTFQQHYDLRTEPDGTVVFTFASNGRQLGQGPVAGDRVTYLSHHQCKFF
jgi:hypothetical protein